MYRTTLYNLSEDLEHASTSFGQRDLGEITEEELNSVLEFLRHIDPVELHEAQPFVSVTTATGRFTVRATTGKLHLYDVSHPELGSWELEPAALIQHITPRFERQRRDIDEGGNVHVVRKRNAVNTSIGVCMLAAGLALNGYTLYAALYIDDVHRAPPLTLITHAAEEQKMRDSIAGYYVTGTEPGDRTITLRNDGTAELVQLGKKGAARMRQSCTFLVGKRDGRFFLALKPRGQVEITGLETLSFYGDTYRRQR